MPSEPCDLCPVSLSTGSTLVRKEGDTTAIIVGVGVMVFIFVVVFFVFVKVLYNMLRKNRATTAVTATSYAMSAVSQNGAAVAANVSMYSIVMVC